MSALTIIGGIVVALGALVAIILLLEHFIFAPRRDRDFEQNYERTSLTPTGPFWWFPGPPRKRPHPVAAPEAEARVRVKQMQFLLILALFAIAVLVYVLVF